MIREKTRLELLETPEGEARRLREALFVLSIESDPEEMKRIARCAMAGEKHGKEFSGTEIVGFDLASQYRLHQRCLRDA